MRVFSALNKQTNETARLATRVPTRICAPKTWRASGSFAQYVVRNPMFDGLDLSKVTRLRPVPMDWNFVKRLRDTVAVKLLIKGVVTREDAQIAVEHGVED